jgi:hypothetical protein
VSFFAVGDSPAALFQAHSKREMIIKPSRFAGGFEKPSEIHAIPAKSSLGDCLVQPLFMTQCVIQRCLSGYRKGIVEIFAGKDCSLR